jgi:hypothetical protein
MVRTTFCVRFPLFYIRPWEMGFNKVPKFVEKQIAKRRREGTPSSGSKKKKSFSAFDAARKKFEEKQAQVRQAEEKKAEQAKVVAEKQKERKKAGKLFNKRNERGQPNMNAQLELLMKRL